MSDITTKLKAEADEIRRALDTNAGLYAQRLGNAERALREAIKEIERLEEQWRKTQLSWVLRSELDAAKDRIAELERDGHTHSYHVANLNAQNIPRSTQCLRKVVEGVRNLPGPDPKGPDITFKDGSVADLKTDEDR